MPAAASVSMWTGLNYDKYRTCTNSQDGQLDLTDKYGVLGHPDLLLLSGHNWAANLPPDQLDTSL